MNDEHRAEQEAPAESPAQQEASRIAASQSFTIEEVSLLGQLFEHALRGADSRILARAPAFANLARKVGVMRATIERKKAERARVPR